MPKKYCIFVLDCRSVRKKRRNSKTVNNKIFIYDKYRITACKGKSVMIIICRDIMNSVTWTIWWNINFIYTVANPQGP